MKAHPAESLGGCKTVPFELRASDGFSLATTRFEPIGETAGTLVVHSATAVPQRIYRGFSEFAAANGLRVVTYDYRGVGRSRPDSLRGFSATMTEWADLDARSVHRHVRAQWGEAPIAILGHSFGGQLVGMVEETHEVAAAVFVGAQLGYYGNWPLFDRIRLGAILHGLMPVATRTFGYLPGRFGLGEDLPRGVADEWASWCRHPDYLISSHPGAAGRYASFDRPTLFYSFTDDAFAPRGAVDALLGKLSSAPIEHRRVDPRAHGGRPIGHFGFFRPHFRGSLWKEAIEFVEDVFAGRPRAPADIGPPFHIRMEDVMADLRH